MNLSKMKSITPSDEKNHLVPKQILQSSAVNETNHHSIGSPPRASIKTTKDFPLPTDNTHPIMSLSLNAEESDANQSKFYKVLSSKPVTNADALFDTLSKFLTKDKKRQIAMEFLDEKDLLSSRLAWNNLRNVANCVIEEGCSKDRDPIPAWVEQKDPIVVDEETTPIEITGNPDTTEESDSSPQQAKDTVKVEPESPAAQTETKEDAKKAKKEAKEARKRERAEKRKAKEARREEREAKRAKKEAKKKRTE